MRVLKRMGLGLGLLLGLYLILRAVLEFFVIDFADPATYEKDWGGPSLAGVLLVHCGFGVLSAVVIARWLVRRRRSVHQ
jgi:hypothetical protein